MQGHFALLLHAHLPFVRHPEHEKFLEENWLFEAITETYIPLIQMLEGWQDDGMSRAPDPLAFARRSAPCCWTRCLQDRYVAAPRRLDRPGRK